VERNTSFTPLLLYTLRKILWYPTSRKLGVPRAGPNAATRKIAFFIREFNSDFSIVGATAEFWGCSPCWNKTRTKWQAGVSCSCIRFGRVTTSWWNVFSGIRRSYKPRSKVERRHTKEYQHTADRTWTKDIENKSYPTPVFLNRRAADRYRALASIIPGSERFSCNLSF